MTDDPHDFWNDPVPRVSTHPSCYSDAEYMRAHEKRRAAYQMQRAEAQSLMNAFRENQTLAAAAIEDDHTFDNLSIESCRDTHAGAV